MEPSGFQGFCSKLMNTSTPNKTVKRTRQERLTNPTASTRTGTRLNPGPTAALLQEQIVSLPRTDSVDALNRALNFIAKEDEVRAAAAGAAAFETADDDFAWEEQPEDSLSSTLLPTAPTISDSDESFQNFDLQFSSDHNTTHSTPEQDISANPRLQRNANQRLSRTDPADDPAYEYPLVVQNTGLQYLNLFDIPQVHNNQLQYQNQIVLLNPAGLQQPPVRQAADVNAAGGNGAAGAAGAVAAPAAAAVAPVVAANAAVLVVEGGPPPPPPPNNNNNNNNNHNNVIYVNGLPAIHEENADEIDFNMLMNSSIQIPHFDPANPLSTDAITFLDHFSRWNDAQPPAGWDDRRRIALLGLHLRGSANSWFTSYTAAKKAANEWDALTIDEVKTAFLAAFPSSTGKQQLEEKLISKVMLPGESVETYLYTVLDLVSKVDPTMPFTRIYAHVMRGLPPMLSGYLKTTNPTDVAQLTKNLLDLGAGFVGHQPTIQYAPLSSIPYASQVALGFPPNATPEVLQNLGLLRQVQNASNTMWPATSFPPAQMLPQLMPDVTVQQAHNQLKAALDNIVESQAKAKSAEQKSDKTSEQTINTLAEQLAKVTMATVQANRSNNQNNAQNQRRNWQNNRGWARVNVVNATPNYNATTPNYVPNANFVPRNYGGNNRGNFRYSFRGGRGNFRGRGNYRNNTEGLNLGRDSTGRAVCFECQSPTHMRRDCPNLTQQNEAKN
jgi:hypothetical protein